MDYGAASIKMHLKKNVLKVVPNVKLETKADLSTYYTPGIAAVSKEIAADKRKVFDLTIKRNTVAVVSDGSAVLGLGNIGPEAALPVMEGKSLLFAEFAGIDAFPICLATQDVKEIIQCVKNMAPVFGGINLEDISAPRCFEIEDALQNLGIPVMHDDQHGTAVVVLAGLINALKVVDKKIEECKIVISGAGAAGTAITKLLLQYSKIKPRIVVLDTTGSIYNGRIEMTPFKEDLARITANKEKGQLKEIIKDADVFIGVSAPNILTGEMVKTMGSGAIVFAMANPVPEIDPKVAKEAGAKVVATGRSDYPNQINNVLAFPGIFRGAIDAKATKITQSMKLSAALALAKYVKNPTASKVIPEALDRNVSKIVAAAVKEASTYDKAARN